MSLNVPRGLPLENPRVEKFSEGIVLPTVDNKKITPSYVESWKLKIFLLSWIFEKNEERNSNEEKNSRKKENRLLSLFGEILSINVIT